MKTCAAVLAGCAVASSLAGETVFTVTDHDQDLFEASARAESMVAPLAQTIADSWSVRSTVRVTGAELSFATDHRRFDAHDYRINDLGDLSGFTAEPGPINAVEIVLLENLHPQFPEFSGGTSEEVVSTSTAQRMTSTRNASWNAIDRIISSTGPGPVSPGAGGGMLRSTSGGTGWTDEVVLPPHLGFSGDDPYVIYPAGWSSSDGHGSDGGSQHGKYVPSSSISGTVMVVPLPLPAVLTGVGLMMAIFVRRRMGR